MTSHCVAANELDRDFDASRFNKKKVTDVPFVQTE